MPATDLQEQVIRELKFDPSIDASRIGVTATDGVVTLTGTVPAYLQRLQAESAAKRVKAVKAVANEIQVRLPGDIKRTDTVTSPSAQWTRSGGAAAFRLSTSKPPSPTVGSRSKEMSTFTSRSRKRSEPSVLSLAYSA
jgi:BON domain